MRTKILLLGMFLGLGFAQVQAKDTTYMVRQILGNNIKTLELSEMAEVEITQGDSNCVFYYSKTKIKTPPTIAKIDGNKLTIHDVKSGKIKVVLRDNVELIELKKTSQAIVLTDFSFKSKKTTIKMDGFAKMKFNETLKANILNLDLESFATIAINSVDIDSLMLNLADYSTTMIESGTIKGLINRDGILKTSPVVKIYTEGMEFVVESGVSGLIETTSSLGDNLIKREREKRLHGSWSTEFIFGLGAYNWSNDYFAMGDIPDNYQLAYGTSYILEARARYTFPGDRFSVDLGIGYESDVVLLSSNVEYSKPENDFILSSDEYVNTKVVSRYITIPVMFNVNLNSIFMGAGIVAGLNYNNSNTGVFAENSANDFVNCLYYSYNFNPYKLDFRAVFGFELVHVFFQTSLLSEIVNDMYPYRIGIMISL